MKLTHILILLIAVTGIARAQRSTNPYTTPQSEAPNVASPVQNPTRVPLGGPYERTKMRINAGNDIVTGNVGGGREFRGSLPYNVQSQLGTGLSDSGAGSVRSFLRRSSGSPYFPSYGDSSKPYYDPLLATTSLRPSDQSGLSRPVVTTPTSIAKISVPEWSSLQRLSMPQRPAWQETTELESRVMQQMGLRELALMEEQLAKLDPAQLERINPNLRRLLETTEEPTNKVTNKPSLLFDDSLRPVLPDQPVEPVQLTEAERLKIQRDQIEQMRKELEMLLEPEPAAPTRPKPKPAPETTEPAKKTEPTPGLPPLPQTPTESAQPPVIEAEKPVEKPFQLPTPEQRTRIRQLLGPYKSFEALTADKTADYLRQGDQFMVKRQFYRAADAYTLATVWQSNDPQVYLKQTLALFAAGAYLSSAQSLQRAILLKPELAGEKIDFVNRLGGNVSSAGNEESKLIQDKNKDLYQTRMKEVVAFLNNSDSGMLALLMTYCYFQEGNLDKAKEAIAISIHYYPDDPAVVAMQKALSVDTAPSKAAP